MAQNSFNSLTGGLVNSVVANVGNSLSKSIQNIGNPNPSSAGWASVSVNSLLSSTIKTTTGYALNAGENYLLSQLGGVLPRGQNAALVNAVATQVAAAGIKQVTGFVSQSIGGLFGGKGANVTTAGLSAQSARGSKSVLTSVVSKLPQADYGGQAYTLDDIVFTLVPANAGAQTAPQVQSPPTVPTNVAYSSSTNLAPKAISSLKTATAFALPATGATAKFSTGATLVSAPKINTSNIKSSW